MVEPKLSVSLYSKSLTMQKEFIPYELALELKELGFDGTNCMRFYNAELSLENTFLYSGNVGAPLYQQAFRWFRDKYQIYSWIYIEYKPFKFGYHCFSNENRGVGLGKVSEYQTYEEAELECLKKLIELVKTK